MLSLFGFCLFLMSASAVEIQLTGSPTLTHAPSPVYVYSAPSYNNAQFRAQDIFGQYSYAYATDNGIKQSETRGLDGNVAGGYSYTSPEGQKVSITYTAGKDGFQPTNDALPQTSTRGNPDVKATAQENKPENYKAQSSANAASYTSIINPLAYVSRPKPSIYASPALPYAYLTPFKTGQSYSYYSPATPTGKLVYYGPGNVQQYYFPQF